MSGVNSRRMDFYIKRQKSRCRKFKTDNKLYAISTVSTTCGSQLPPCKYLVVYGTAIEHPYRGCMKVAFYHKKDLLMLNHNGVIVVIESTPVIIFTSRLINVGKKKPTRTLRWPSEAWSSLPACTSHTRGIEHWM